jgi:hypothetical protein
MVGSDFPGEGGHTLGFNPMGGGGSHTVGFTTHTCSIHVHINNPAGGPIGGSDPKGGGVHTRVSGSWGGPHRRIRSTGGVPPPGVSFEFEGGCGTSFYVKNHMQKNLVSVSF